MKGKSLRRWPCSFPLPSLALFTQREPHSSAVAFQEVKLRSRRSSRSTPPISLSLLRVDLSNSISATCEEREGGFILELVWGAWCSCSSLSPPHMLVTGSCQFPQASLHFALLRDMQTASMAAWLQEPFSWSVCTPGPPCLLLALHAYCPVKVWSHSPPSSKTRIMAVVSCMQGDSPLCRPSRGLVQPDAGIGAAKSRPFSLQSEYWGGWHLCAQQDPTLVRVSQWTCPDLHLHGDSE